MSDSAPSRSPRADGGADDSSPLQALKNWLRGLLRSRNGEASLRDAIEELIEESEGESEEALISRDESSLLLNILKLRDLTARDVMVPRADIAAVPLDIELDALVRTMTSHGHSRLPVYRETLDDVVGMVHIKDVLACRIGDRSFELAAIAREVLFVAPSMRALDLLLQMRLSRIHMALVVDEFGGIDGLITIEDVVEEIVGEIEDEHDVARGPRLVARPDGTLIADARATIEEFEQRVGPVLSDEEREQDIDTLGGLVFSLIGRVPTRGELITHPSGIAFEVLEADPRRMTPRGGPAAAAAAIAARVGALAGWRRRGAAALLGGVAALALPPLHALPLLVVAFTGLVWLLDSARRPAAAFAVGWWFGFGHFVVGLYWLAHAFLTDPEKFAWMIPFAVFGLAGVLALFPALAALLARRLWGGGAARVIVLAVAWTALEWLRGWIWTFTGFPWNLIGYSWAFADPMNQFAALAGIWGLSFVTVAAAGMPAVLADLPAPSRRFAPAFAKPASAGEGRSAKAGGRTAVAAWGAIATAALAIVGIWIGGALRLAGAADDSVAGVRLRLVQAAIDQRQKNDADRRAANLLRHLRLTVGTPGFAAVSHVIWPEAAAQFLLEREPALRAALAAAAPPGGVLITGAPRGDPALGPVQRIWNGLVAIDPAGDIVATYDKFHLVPFGEYVPWRTLFPFLSKITPGSMDFSAGPGPRTLRLPGLPPVGPLICYEAIFPGAVADPRDRPDWLLNLTNDGWYGISSGPYQHFASARLRAVEEGMPLVRAANTGISGVVDAYGRVTARLGLGETGVLDAGLPKPLAGRTPYARFGDATLAVLLGVALLGAALLRRFSR